MPHVTIDTLQGKTQQDKQRLVDHVIAGFEDIGVAPGSVTIVIRDVDHGNYFLGREDMNAYQARRNAAKGEQEG